MNENILVPDSITPVVGWRGWRVGPAGLLSMSNTYRWVPQHTAVAQCNFPGPAFLSTAADRFHVAPDERCQCGFYAARARWIVAEIGPQIIGRVALWGKVIEYDDGWRAERAYPQSFFILPEQADLRPILEPYGVPILSRSDLAPETPRCSECQQPISEEQPMRHRLDSWRLAHIACWNKWRREHSVEIGQEMFAQLYYAPGTVVIQPPQQSQRSALATLRSAIEALLS